MSPVVLVLSRTQSETKLVPWHMLGVSFFLGPASIDGGGCGGGEDEA